MLNVWCITLILSFAKIEPSHSHTQKPKKICPTQQKNNKKTAKKNNCFYFVSINLKRLFWDEFPHPDFHTEYIAKGRWKKTRLLYIELCSILRGRLRSSRHWAFRFLRRSRSTNDLVYKVWASSRDSHIFSDPNFLESLDNFTCLK